MTVTDEPARKRLRARLKKLRQRGYDVDLMARCEATTTARRGRHQCPFFGYYDPVDGGFRCEKHEARS